MTSRRQQSLRRAIYNGVFGAIAAYTLGLAWVYASAMAGYITR